VSHDAVHDLVGSTGISKQLREHRTERDQDAHPGSGSAEPVAKRVEHVSDVLPCDNADGDGAENQREEGMQLGDRDQYDNQRDTRQRGQDQLPAASYGFSQLSSGQNVKLPGSSVLLFGFVRVADNVTKLSMMESIVLIDIDDDAALIGLKGLERGELRCPPATRHEVSGLLPVACR